MLGAVYTHYALNERFDRMAPGIIFGLLLFTRLIIYWQGKHPNLNISNEKFTELKKKIENKEEKDNTQELVDEGLEDQPAEEEKAANEKKKD